MRAVRGQRQLPPKPLPRPGRRYGGRRAVCETLVRIGARPRTLRPVASVKVRLHGTDVAPLQIPAAKAETGISEVQMSPDLVEAIIEPLDRRQRLEQPTGPGPVLVASKDRLSGGDA